MCPAACPAESPARGLPPADRYRAMHNAVGSTDGRICSCHSMADSRPTDAFEFLSNASNARADIALRWGTGTNGQLLNAPSHSTVVALFVTLDPAMISLRAALALQVLRDFVSRRAVPRRVQARCARCADECLVNLREITLQFGRFRSLASAGEVLRCEKCNGQLVRRPAVQWPTGICENQQSTIIDLAAYRRVRVELAGIAQSSYHPHRGRGLAEFR
jgi:hypothetical protein